MQVETLFLCPKEYIYNEDEIEDALNFIQFFNELPGRLLDIGNCLNDDIVEEAETLRRIFRNNIEFLKDNVTSLDLRDCRLTALPKEISALKNLEVLDISGNRFEAFPEFVFTDFSNLQKLEASNCNFSRVPITILALNNLQSLNVSFNSLEMANIEQEVIDFLFNREEFIY